LELRMSGQQRLQGALYNDDFDDFLAMKALFEGAV